MKKTGIVLILLTLTGITGCGIANGDTAIIGGADGPTAAFIASNIGKDEEAEETGEAGGQPEEKEQKSISDVQALTAIKNYCYISNPDLKNIEDSGEYTMYWDIESSSDREMVVMFRSYTAAQVRYYIDRTTGDTYVTEFVPGITDEEKRTDEEFNVWDYADGEIVNVYEVTDLDLAEEYSQEGKLFTTVCYFEMADGTWRTKYNSYQYRLEISGRLPGAAEDSTFVYLSNIEDISFKQAYMAAGLSSNSEDYFEPKEAVLVAMK